MKLSQVRKAVLGFVAPGAVVIGSAVLKASDGGSTITTAELITALVAMVVTGSGVGIIRNEGTVNGSLPRRARLD